VGIPASWAWLTAGVGIEAILSESGAVRAAVIVPVYGWAPYLAQTLDAVLAQVPAPEEIVVVDDGSPEPLALHPDHRERCELIRRPARGGPAAARASALEHSDAGLVALCDADDAWEPGLWGAQLRALDAHPDAALCFGRALVVGPDDRPTGERWAQPAPGRHAGADALGWLYEANPVPTSSVVLRRAPLEAAGGLDSPRRRAEDWELWLRLLARCEALVCVPGAVVRYRRHPTSLTADIAALARAQLELHAEFAHLVSEAVGRRAQASDHYALAEALARAGRRGAARESLAQGRALAPPNRRQRQLALMLAVPGASSLVGARARYRA